MNKKLFATLLAGAMVLGCGTAAFAEEVDMNEDGTINNPEAVEIADGSLSMWSLFTGVTENTSKLLLKDTMEAKQLRCRFR